jgi:hypothetical protein
VAHYRAAQIEHEAQHRKEVPGGDGQTPRTIGSHGVRPRKDAADALPPEPTVADWSTAKALETMELGDQRGGLAVSSVRPLTLKARA